MAAIRSVFVEARGAPVRTYRWDITWNNVLQAPGESVQVAIPYQTTDQPVENLDPDEISFVQGAKQFGVGSINEGAYVDFELTFDDDPNAGGRVAICTATSSILLSQDDTVAITYWFKWYKQNEGGISTFPTVPVP